MATSQRSSVRKPESVQFWLCVGAVSLALHSSLLFGLQRWARVTIVQPDESPIAVELVDAPETVVSQVEPDTIAQVSQKPDSKPAAQPEVAAPEVKLEVKPDVQLPEPEPKIKPEPIIQPSTNADRKKITPAIVPKPSPSTASPAPNKAPKPKSIKSPKPSSSTPPTKPIASGTELTPPPSPGSGPKSVRFETVGAIGLTAQSRTELKGQATLSVPDFPTLPAPTNLPLRLGAPLSVKTPSS